MDKNSNGRKTDEEAKFQSIEACIDAGTSKQIDKKISTRSASIQYIVWKQKTFRVQEHVVLLLPCVLWAVQLDRKRCHTRIRIRTRQAKAAESETRIPLLRKAKTLLLICLISDTVFRYAVSQCLPLFMYTYVRPCETVHCTVYTQYTSSHVHVNRDAAYANRCGLWSGDCKRSCVNVCLSEHTQVHTRTQSGHQSWLLIANCPSSTSCCHSRNGEFLLDVSVSLISVARNFPGLCARLATVLTLLKIMLIIRQAELLFELTCLWPWIFIITVKF